VCFCVYVLVCICILGLHSASPVLNRHRIILSLLWYCARLSILQQWMDSTTPPVSSWLHNILQLLPLERLTHVLQGDMNGFFSVFYGFYWRGLCQNHKKRRCNLGTQVTVNDGYSWFNMEDYDLCLCFYFLPCLIVLIVGCYVIFIYYLRIENAEDNVLIAVYLYQWRFVHRGR